MQKTQKIYLKLIIALGLVISLPQMAAADSDGLLCQGNGFLAYELRHFDSDGIHRLYIVKPSDGASAIVQTQHIIPETVGQVHALSCSEDSSVLVSAFKTAARFSLANGVFTSGQTPEKNSDQKRLGPRPNAAKPQIKILEDWGTKTHQFELHQLSYMFPETGNQNGIIEHHSIDRIVRINKAGHFFDGAHTLLEDMKIETID